MRAFVITAVISVAAPSTAKEFKPKWLDAYLLEYTEPHGKGRVKLNVNNGYAAGIDCDKTTSRVGKLVCADDTLLGADCQLSYYYQVLLSASTDIESAERVRLAWLAKRNKYIKGNRTLILAIIIIIAAHAMRGQDRVRAI